MFAPFIQSESDVIGKESLNSILAEFPEVETRHFKLWLASTNVLQSIFNLAISGRSHFEIRRIREKAQRFVPTKDYDKALKFLKKSNVVILTGEPGIGKTTLALFRASPINVFGIPP